MDKKIIHIKMTKRYVNGILVALVLCYLYIFIFFSFSFIFWSGAFVLFGVLCGVRFYLSKKVTISQWDIAAAQKAMRDTAQNLSLEYHTHGTPRYRPLFESTELAQRKQNKDSSLKTPKEERNVEHFVRGRMEGQFIECFVQEAELDLGMGPVRKSYIAAETDAELIFFDIKFFVTPRSRKKGIAGFIHRISQNPFAGAVDFKQLRTESPNFNHAYAIWVRRYDSQDEEMVLKILTPEFIKMTLEYKEPVYIEVVHDKIRIYHDIHNITAKKIENMLKLLVHMKNTITQRRSPQR
ncbi:MAG: hypothetical protein NUV42_02090 [Candidatus Yonathbacteria bacterium]|nr:hypothetical protein [Candidatus Yonathbacteria bacterium]